MGTSKLPFGSPEELVAEGTARAIAVVERWTDEILDAVDGVARPDAIIDHTMLALSRLKDADMGELVAEVGTRGAMLGALDSEWEVTREVRIEPARFDRTIELPSGNDFTLRPFTEAIEDFKAREPVTKDVWLRMSAEERKRAFTVAYLAKVDMVDAVKAELMRSLEDGTDLRHFRKLLRLRFEERGWSGLNPSHVETVFRTGVMGSYARGRHAQMSQPLMLKLRPFWQVFTVADSRRRPTHGAMHGKALRADDPFWQRAPLPWGFNCRCRVVARSEDWITKNGTTIVEGASVSDLPDPGWDSKSSMPSVAAPVSAPAGPPPPPQPAAPAAAAPLTTPAKPRQSFALGKHVQAIDARGRLALATHRELAAALERDHPELLQRLERFPIRKLRLAPRGRRGVMGSFTPATGELFVKAARAKSTYGGSLVGAWSISSVAKTPHEAELRTFVHEVGHHLHRSSVQVDRIIQTAWKAWQLAGNNPSVTQYSRTNFREYFAESFAAYHFERAHLQSVDPGAFSMVEKVLKELDKP